MGQIAPINRTFTATIEDRDGWACVNWPESVAFFGSTKSVKVERYHEWYCLPDSFFAMG